MLLAIAACLFNACLYVLVLYVKRGLPRDHATTIKQRALAVLGVCCVAWIPTYLCKLYYHNTAPMLPLLGLKMGGLVHCAICLTATTIFFLGPVSWKVFNYFAWGGKLVSLDLKNLRDLVVAPITEEFVFRACMVPLLGFIGTSSTVIIFVTPLFFGAAHVHHVYEKTVHGRMSLQSALASIAFQFLYTTVFGWYATFLFVQTGYLLVTVVIHSFCNFIGVPPFPEMFSHRHRYLFMVLTIAGVVGFIFIFSTATRISQFVTLAGW